MVHRLVVLRSSIIAIGQQRSANQNISLLALSNDAEWVNSCTRVELQRKENLGLPFPVQLHAGKVCNSQALALPYDPSICQLNRLRKSGDEDVP